jgi:arylsulfatase
MFIRQVDVFAAYVAYTDHEIGRVIQAVDDMGKLDNTLVIYISGDNGGSAEGTEIGTPNEVASFNGVDVPVADQLKNFYDAWGSDLTYNHMVVAENPAKLKEMQEIFWREAEKYQVLPLNSTVATRLVTPRPSITAGRDVFTWTMPLTGTPNGDAPSILNASYHFEADIDVPQGGAEGMLITQGGRFGGYGFYLLKGKPVFRWNLVDLERLRWEGPQALSPGKHTLEFEFTYDGLGMGTLAYNSLTGIGRGGKGVLKVNGKVVAEQMMKRTIPLILQWAEALDVGSDTLTGVDDRDYQPPFAFTGKIDKITLTINRPKLTPADIEKLAAATRNNKTSE